MREFAATVFVVLVVTLLAHFCFLVLLTRFLWWVLRAAAALVWATALAPLAMAVGLWRRPDQPWLLSLAVLFTGAHLMFWGMLWAR